MNNIIENKLKYCESIFSTIRRETREVMVGTVGVGGSNPIRVQSMTTTPTLDTLKTVAQTIRMVEAGCEIVRITAQGPKEAANLGPIKSELLKRGCEVPLVADIHFNPAAAMEAVKHVEKVRINPGNYADTKVFKQRDYTDTEYDRELMRIYEKFSPLVKELKTRGKSLRIGTNHGSLSDRIMNRYGDTALGMVESAIEFAKICEDMQFYDFMFSMKASNPQVMVQAYRLLCQRMYLLGMNYPLHLGVTEAGEGEDGRVKSALGIGLLLEDGIGDTIRVSLTEEPEHEVPVAYRLIEKYARPLKNAISWGLEEQRNPFALNQSLEKWEAEYFKIAPEFQVFVSFPSHEKLDAFFLKRIGYLIKGNECTRKDVRADVLFFDRELTKEEQEVLLLAKGVGLKTLSTLDGYDFCLGSYDAITAKQDDFIGIDLSIATKEDVEMVLLWQKPVVIYCNADNKIGKFREFFALHQSLGSQVPVIIKDAILDQNLERAILRSSYECGGMLLEGYGKGLWLESKFPLEKSLDFVFTLLQATRIRITKTEYISCPSCGRTLFDLQETTEKIRQKTSHLKGVKIAVMGCIVNGPGEMADADFGYVGSAPNKVNLYVGKDLAVRGVEESVADERLVTLLKEHGAWVEPEINSEENKGG